MPEILIDYGSHSKSDCKWKFIDMFIYVFVYAYICIKIYFISL